jgi:hypothetical protein
MLHEFNPSDVEHVTWLKKVIDAKVEDKYAIFKDNPMKADSPAFDMIQVLFALSMKYTKAVFTGSAAVPS